MPGEKLRYLRLIAKQSQLYGQVVKDAANKVTQQAQYPEDNELAQQLKIVSRLIKGGMQTPLYLVRLGGFDTHDAQEEKNDHTKGEHAELLKTVNDAITSFMQDLELQGTDDRVIGMTFSEFGRRIVSNASLGTDHGSAAPMFVFGNKVKAGISGSNPIISNNAKYDDNLPMQHDFRQVYASLMEQWFNADTTKASSVLFNQFETLPIIAKKETITGLLNQPSDPALKVYPNPLNGKATIDFLSDGQAIHIKLVDIQGRLVQNIYQGQLPTGRQNISWATERLTRGQYFVVVESEKLRLVRAVIKTD